MTPLSRRHLFTLTGAGLIGFAAAPFYAAPSPADTSGDKNTDKKRQQLAHIKRLAVISPFFGTDTLAKAAEAETGAKPEAAQNDGAKRDTRRRANKSDPARLAQYAGYLQKLQDDAQVYLPQRLGKRTGLEILNGESVANALKTLQVTPEKLFENNGRIKGTKFPLPLAAAMRQVADALHADAIVLGVLDEPRRANGKYLFDPFSGFSYEPGYVETHGGFYLMLPEGGEGLHGYMRVRNPMSKAGGREFVLADWIDAQELMIENMMDEWTYLLPKKP